MLNIKKLLLLPIVAIACLFTRIDSAYAVDYPFSLTTSSISSGGTFQFSLSAQGTFYVDCGTGGTLSSDDSTANAMISGGTINKTDTTKYTFKCTYSSAGTKTIRFGGTATNYSTSTSTAAISFYTSNANAALITSISGNLSTIFPYISGNAADGTQPRFYRAFYSAKNIESIPDTLFSGYTVASTYMFSETFRGCGLTSIPANLFFPNATSVSGVIYMFRQTFLSCKGLTSIPANLFSKITSGAQSMFSNTFMGCSNLTGFIPPTLFDGLIKNNAATNTFSNTFGNTGMSTSCPSGATQYASTYTSAWGGKVSCLVSISLNWYDGNTQLSGGASSCTYGGTFSLPPTPAARTGYIFTGWRVKAVNP